MHVLSKHSNTDLGLEKNRRKKTQRSGEKGRGKRKKREGRQRGGEEVRDT